MANDDVVRVELSMDMDALLGEIAEGRLPGPSCDREATVLEIGVNPQPSIRMAS